MMSKLVRTMLAIFAALTLAQMSCSAQDDMQIADYVERIKALIETNRSFNTWEPSAKQPTISFSVIPDGSIRDIKLTESSGSNTLDQAAILCVRDSSPLPLPPADSPDPLPVVMKFHALTESGPTLYSSVGNTDSVIVLINFATTAAGLAGIFVCSAACLAGLLRRNWARSGRFFLINCGILAYLAVFPGFVNLLMDRAHDSIRIAWYLGGVFAVIDIICLLLALFLPSFLSLRARRPDLFAIVAVNLLLIGLPIFTVLPTSMKFTGLFVGYVILMVIVFGKPLMPAGAKPPAVANAAATETTPGAPTNATADATSEESSANEAISAQTETEKESNTGDQEPAAPSEEPGKSTDAP
ncbi:MAG TPA: energy transducer TonB [Chroococcales cyanobacterium]